MSIDLEEQKEIIDDILEKVEYLLDNDPENPVKLTRVKKFLEDINEDLSKQLHIEAHEEDSEEEDLY